jgi:asparagine synthase (glutamine-hydrolysing)
MLEPHISPEILYRPKMGFSVPLARWFRGPLRQSVRSAVLGPVLAETGWFNPAYLRRLVDDHQSGRRDYSATLWTVLMFESFLRKVMGFQAEGAARAAV